MTMPGNIDNCKGNPSGNGGHGEAVNAGIRNATGLYFKVVDSDDWVNKEAYVQILKTLYELLRGPQTVDLLISNFVYEKQGQPVRKSCSTGNVCHRTEYLDGKK